MLLDKPLDNFGKLRGTIYDFEAVGDVLPSHIHDEATNHISIVARGRVRVYADDWSIEAVAGQIVDFKVGQPHEFEALEDNSRIINIIKS